MIPFATSVALMLWYWPGSLPEDNASGVWTALAQDLARGVFYRPPADAFGFGGTRYMPLFFVLHAGLIRLAVDPVVAGLILTIASVLLFDLGILFVLRELGVEWSLALPLAVLAHAAIAFQVLTLQVKGDFLAAALVLWGVYFGLRVARRFAPLEFGLCVIALLAAFLTKFTALGGAMAVCGWLSFRGRARLALALAGTLGALVLASVAFIDWASAGRAFASFAAVAGGGSRPGYALGAPLWFVLIAAQDPVFVVIVGVACAYAVARLRDGEWGFPVMYFLFTAALTVLIFTSPGTDTNHFLDLLAASTLLLGAELAARPERARVAATLPGLLAVLTLGSFLPGMMSVKSVIEKSGKPERWEIGAIAARLGPEAHDLLSENPIVPIMLGQRPRVLDPFTLRLLAAEHAEIATDFARRMATHSFGAVILVDFTSSDRRHLPAALKACTASDGARCYGGVVFPAGFLRQLERDYVLSFVERPFVVYTPRPGPVVLSSARARRARRW